MKISEERISCPELLLNPSMNGFKFDGIHIAIIDSIKKCDIDIHKDLYANIVLSGSTTMFESFPERIKEEITRNAPPSMNANVVALPERRYGSWFGGSAFASLDTFPQKVITSDEYNDVGAGIVHRKCLL